MNFTDDRFTKHEFRDFLMSVVELLPRGDTFDMFIDFLIGSIAVGGSWHQINSTAYAASDLVKVQRHFLALLYNMCEYIQVCMVWYGIYPLTSPDISVVISYSYQPLLSGYALLLFHSKIQCIIIFGWLFDRFSYQPNVPSILVFTS